MLNQRLTHLTRQILSEADLIEFLKVKNKALNKTGQRICVDRKSAYQMDVVPASTIVNLLQSQILCHITFDVGNDTQSCRIKINRRIEDSKKSQYVPPPLKWTNHEYIIPLAFLFAICITSITMNLMLCSGHYRRGGPRCDLEL